MIGHTDKATVNARRPLSEGMRETLKAVYERDIPQYGQDNASKNRLRALMDRGYVIPCQHEHRGVWRITAEGKKAREAMRHER